MEGTTTAGEKLSPSWRLGPFIIAAGLAAALAACGGGPGPAPASPAPATMTVRPPSPAPPAAAAPVVLCVGTSLTAGFGLDPDDAWPNRLQERIREAGLPHRVVNAGVSGETSAGARRRVDWLLRQKVDVFVLETGANDALRGQDVRATRENVEAILARAKRQSPPPRLVLVGMQAPPNLGREYTESFRRIFPEVAQAHSAALVPFLLEGVGGVARLNLPDGVHPTAEGHRVLAENVWKVLERVLRERDGHG